MSEQDQDKTEKATPYKLQEARKRGQVSKSQDVASVFMLLTFTVMFVATAGSITSALVDTFRSVIPTAANVRLNAQNMLPWMTEALEPVLIAMSPLLIALIVAAVLGTLLQAGFVFSSHPITPDFTRLNPAQGIKKFFNLRVLFELFKVSLKLALVGTFLYTGATYFLPDILQLSRLLPAALPGRVMYLLAVTAFILVGIFAVIALLDLGFSKYEYAKRLRMSRRELKDEHKRREGDPEIKSKRKQTQQEMRKRASAVTRVPEADVVLVNPTHLAVALQYRPARMRAPEIRALGSGRVAEAIRRKARRHGIPVIRNQALARALYRTAKLDQPVPEECFESLAPVYRWLMTLPDCKVSQA